MSMLPAVDPPKKVEVTNCVDVLYIAFLKENFEFEVVVWGCIKGTWNKNLKGLLHKI